MLYIHLPTDIEVFRLFVTHQAYFLGGSSTSEKQIAQFFLDAFKGEVMEEISPQYETNFVACRELKKCDKDIFNKIQGLYYGSDNCEYLMPTAAEVEQAYDLFLQYNKTYQTKISFTLVTPYVGEKMLARADAALAYLDARAKKNKLTLEVVVNDFGILRLLHTKYTNLVPLAGRCMHKLLKTPLVDTYGNAAKVPGEMIRNQDVAFIDAKQKEIVDGQNEFYASCEATYSPYASFLQRHKIERVALDFMEKREKLYSKDMPCGIDLYYPWALVFTGRLCDTSAVEFPGRGDYACDEVCPRTCKKYDLFFKLKTVGYKLLQRGNAAWRSEIQLGHLPKGFFAKDTNRIVFAPFIPV